MKFDVIACILLNASGQTHQILNVPILSPLHENGNIKIAPFITASFDK